MTVLAIHPDHLRVAADFMSSFPGGFTPVGLDKARSDVRFSHSAASEAGSVVTIPIRGLIVPTNDPPTSVFGFAFTGTKYIEQAVATADADPDVEKIILEVDSPGGLVTGVLEAAAAIRRAETPVEARAEYMMASAAYWIAAEADEIVVSESSLIGSIGAMAVIKSMRRMAENAGVDVYVAAWPSGKSINSVMSPLTDEARKEVDEEVRREAESFFASVAQARGLEVAAVRNLNARVFKGREAVEKGLADVAAEDRREQMTKKIEAAAPPEDMVAKADLENAVAAARAEAAAAERARIAAILDCTEAEGRQSLARHLAMSTAMTPEEARGILEKAPKDQPKAVVEKDRASGEFDKAMAAQHGAPLSQDPLDGQDEPTAADELLATARNVSPHLAV